MKKSLNGSVCLLFLGLFTGAVFFPNPIGAAQEISEHLTSQNSKAEHLMDQGAKHFNQGQFREAKEYWEQALNLFRKLSDQKDITIPFSHLGNAYYSLGEYFQAIEYFHQSLGMRRKSGDQKGIAESLGNLGRVHRSLGEYAQAIDYHHQSLKILQKIGDQKGTAYSLGNLGLAYYSLGEYAKALDYHQQSLKIAQKLGDQQGIASANNNLGLAYYSLGEYSKALDFHLHSLIIRRKIGNQQSIAYSLGNLGLTYDSLGKYAQAIDYYRQSLKKVENSGDQKGIAYTLGNLGNVNYSLGKYVQANDYYQQSLEIARKIGDQKGIAQSLWGLGLTHNNQKQFDQSLTYLRESIQTWENLHRDLSVSQQISFFDTQANSYSALQTVLITLNQPLEALVIAERGRTRALNKQLSGTNAPFNIEQIQLVSKEQNATIVEYTVISNNLLYVWVIRPDGTINYRPINGQQLGKTLITVEEQTRQWLENIRGVKDLNQDNTVPQLLANANLTDLPSTPTTLRHLRQLHALLIKPIEDYLPNDPEARVIIIPHRSLFLVPFPALQDDDGTKPQYLIDKHTILTAPSIQSLKHLQDQRQRQKKKRPHGSQKALIIGNPSSPSNCFNYLEGAQDEAKRVAKWFKKSKPVLGDKATETLVKKQLSNVDVIHLAAHGKFNYVNPLKNILSKGRQTVSFLGESKCYAPPPAGGSIVLAPDIENDGYLQTHEVTEITKGQQLQAQLVVLSACETGLGKITGDGIIGLSRSLLAAGVSTVVVSLWSVSDQSTTMLMNEFYTNVYGKGWDKAKSLTAAMRTTKKQYPDPGQWAAFTLIGLPN